jgi:hypothetical protein
MRLLAETSSRQCQNCAAHLRTGSKLTSQRKPPPVDALLPTTRASRNNSALRSAVAAEIQLLTCGYSAQCIVRGCGARAARLARHTDGQGRPLKQRELCGRHADWLKSNRPNVHDLRNTTDA